MVPVVRSQEMIRKLILQNKGTAVAFISQPPTEGLEAQIPMEGEYYRIRISAKCRPPEGKVKTKWQGGKYVEVPPDPEKEARRIWRVIYYHLKSVFDSANTGVIELRELLLPHIVTADNQTVAEHIIPNLSRAMTGKPERLLPAARQ